MVVSDLKAASPLFAKVAVSEYSERVMNAASPLASLSRFASFTAMVSGSWLAVSCGLNCSTHCEHGPTILGCPELPVPGCVDGGTAYACSVRPGCRCAIGSGANQSTVTCDNLMCSFATEPASCSSKMGCEWGDSCRDLIDCHSFDNDENACNANYRQCYWT
jgi:hypothetical protein